MTNLLWHYLRRLAYVLLALAAAVVVFGLLRGW